MGPKISTNLVRYSHEFVITVIVIIEFDCKTVFKLRQNTQVFRIEKQVKKTKFGRINCHIHVFFKVHCIFRVNFTLKQMFFFYKMHCTMLNLRVNRMWQQAFNNTRLKLYVRNVIFDFVLLKPNQ